MSDPSARPRRRWLAGLLWSVAVVIAVLAPAYWFVVAPTFRAFPAAAFPAPANQAEAYSQDLSYLRQLPDIDPSFSQEEHAAFDNAIDDLTARADQLSRAGFEMGIAAAVALAGNGHTNAIGAARGVGVNSVPLRFGWFAEGLFVVKASPVHAGLVGARVVAIEGRDPSELRKELGGFIGGRAEFGIPMTLNLLASPEALHTVGLAGSANALTLDAVSTQGDRIEATVPATDEPIATYGPDYYPQRELSPQPLPKAEGEWVHVLDGKPFPFYLDNPDRGFQHHFPEPDVLHLQLREVRSRDGADLGAYLETVLAEVAERKARHAVVDLRLSGGGDYTQIIGFSAKLPEALAADGKLIILSGNRTFSAAISLLARLKAFAGDRAIILGEGPGDHESFWAEGGRAVLPNSGRIIRYSTVHHDWENGCRLSQLGTCYFLNYLFGVAAGKLSPPNPTTLSFADYVDGHDPLLASALSIIGEK